MMTREEAVAYALIWKGTPYVTGGRVPGAGCDCATLLAEYLIAIGASTRDELGVYSQDWFCHATEERYRLTLEKHAALAWEGICMGTPPARPGDVAIYRVVGSKVYNHGSIITGWPKALHAFHERVAEVRPALHPLTAHREMAIFDPWRGRGAL
jgi:cell wall-associated NlpC family hydrolase